MASDIQAFDALVGSLSVRLEQVIVCSVGRGHRLSLAPLPHVLVHFILDGEACFDVEGAPPFRAPPHSVVIVPPLRRKRVGPDFASPELPPTAGCSVAPDGVLNIAIGSRGSGGIVFACGEVATASLGALDPFGRLSAPLVEDLSSHPAGRALFALLLAESSAPGPGSRAILEALIKQCLILALRSHFLRAGTHPELFCGASDPRLLRAIAAVLEAPERAHATSALAAAAGMSRSVFFARFAESFGCTPMEYVQRVRLDAAARRLATGADPVKRIASDVGFASRSHFSRAFRQRFGMDPTGYRRTLRRAAGDE